MLISAIFRPSQPFFKWYGSLHRKILRCFDEILVQEEASFERLTKIKSIGNVTISGDNRVDRVVEIANNPIPLPAVKAFCGDAPVLVCGSTWPADEAILNPIFRHEKFKEWKFILAPHDVQPAHLQAIESKMEVRYVRFSKLETAGKTDARLLLIDNIGLLASLYSFGKIAYIGGGFGQSIHNTLEPAAYGLPVVFGPKYQKFEEAVWLVEYGGGFEVRDGMELCRKLEELTDPIIQERAAKVAKNYIEQRSGATQKVLERLDLLLKH